MNRQQGIGIGVGVLLGIACVGAGVTFSMAFAKSQEAKTNLDTAFQDLQKMYKAKIFPNDANIAQIKEDQKTLEAWFEVATNQLSKSEVPLESLTPAQFKSKLEGDIREMVRLAAVQGQQSRVAPEFRFGFDRYKDGVLPEKDDVPRLNQQLDIIKLIVEQIYNANIVKLDAIEREVFETTAAKEEPAPTARRKNRDQGGGDVQAGALSPALAELFDSQRFTVAFQAHPDAFASVLNSLSAMNLFIVISDVEIKKAATLRSDQPKKDAAKPAVEQPADWTVTPVAQSVTNPLDEPPANVRLSLDVYSFKGV